MKQQEIKKLLEMVEEVFPLPQDEKFESAHRFELTREGNLQLIVWYRSQDLGGPLGEQIVCMPIEFEPMDQINEESMMRTKQNIMRFEARNQRTPV